MGWPRVGDDAGHVEHGLVGEVAHAGHLLFAWGVEVGDDRVAHMDGDQGLVFAEEFAPAGAGPEGDDQGENRQSIAVGHVESAGFEGTERRIVFPAATLGKDVDPLLIVVKLVQRLVKRPQAAALFRYGDAADVFHQKAILAAEGLRVHRNPSLAVAHRLEHTDHVPSTNMVADRHQAVGKELAVPADLFAAFNL